MVERYSDLGDRRSPAACVFTPRGCPSAPFDGRVRRLKAEMLPPKEGLYKFCRKNKVFACVGLSNKLDSEH